jgi:hypothetical protein
MMNIYHFVGLCYLGGLVAGVFFWLAWCIHTVNYMGSFWFSDA